MECVSKIVTHMLATYLLKNKITHSQCTWFLSIMHHSQCTSVLIMGTCNKQSNSLAYTCLHINIMFVSTWYWAPNEPNFHKMAWVIDFTSWGGGYLWHLEFVSLAILHFSQKNKVFQSCLARTITTIQNLIKKYYVHIHYPTNNFMLSIHLW